MLLKERSKLNKFEGETLGNAVFIGDFEAGTEQWHALRQQGIGGSEIGTIVGLNPYESAYTLWHKKKKLIEEPNLDDNIAVFIGNSMETPILQRFESQHPELEIFVTGTWRNKDKPWMHANPDAIYRHKETGEWGIIEIKTGRNTWPDLPPGYKAQVMWYLNVFGFKTGRVIAIAGYEWQDYLVENDEFEAQAYIDAAIRFKAYLDKEVRPDWDGSQSTYETVRQMNPYVDNTTVEVGDVGVGLWHAQKKSDEAVAELNAYKSAVLDHMGSAKYATTEIEGQGTFTVAYRASRVGGVPYLVVKK
jgi:putative phage-type endonuclease